MKIIKCVGFEMESVSDIPLVLTTWFFRTNADKLKPFVFGGPDKGHERTYHVHETATQIVLRKI